jgi:hypothetical protein
MGPHLNITNLNKLEDNTRINIIENSEIDLISLMNYSIDDEIDEIENEFINNLNKANKKSKNKNDIIIEKKLESKEDKKIKEDNEILEAVTTFKKLLKNNKLNE